MDDDDDGNDDGYDGYDGYEQEDDIIQYANHRRHV